MEERNRNAVNEALKLPLGAAFEKALARRIAENEAAVIVMIDVDCFSHVNERFGHAEGDRVLIETGRYLKEAMPADAEVFRYGGDEFSVLFGVRAEKEDAFLAVEEARRGYAVMLPDGTQPTLTTGVAAVPDDGSSATDVVRSAEGAMFRGKLAGRSRVYLAKEDKMVTKTTHYTAEQLKRLTKVARREGRGEAVLLREALDALLKKYDA